VHRFGNSDSNGLASQTRATPFYAFDTRNDDIRIAKSPQSNIALIQPAIRCPLKQARSLLLLLTASLIPVVVLAAITGRFFIEEQQRALDDQVRAKAATLAASLQRELDAQIKLLTILAESPRLDPPISRKGFAEIARRMRERIPEWEQVRVSDREGNLLLLVPSADPPREQRVVDPVSHESVVLTGAPVVGTITVGPRSC
jgi:hypothetical protein